MTEPRYKKRISTLAAVSVLLLFLLPAVVQAESSANEEVRMSTEVSMLNHDASLPQGEQIVLEKIAQWFPLSSDRISSLATGDIALGEITAALALAGKMPGEISDTTMNTILNSRLEGMGWARIADGLQVDLAEAADMVSAIEEEAHREIKAAAAGTGAEGSAPGGPGTSSERDVGTQGSDL